MLIKKDVNTIREVIKEELKDFRGEMEETFATKEDLKELRSDFFEKIDPILKETVTNREERIINDERISKLEQTVFQ